MEDEEFEWDTGKDAANFAKHKIDFATAKRVFHDPNAVVGDDLSSSHAGDRFFITGQVDGRMVPVVYTYRHDRIRLISAWPSTRREIDDYYRSQNPT